MVSFDFHELTTDNRGNIWAEDNVCYVSHVVETQSKLIECQKCQYLFKRTDIELEKD